MLDDAHKKKRYDRQLRMWGEHGQDALERCTLCLVNGSATGTEALKNLVLPGIGSFTVVDGQPVTARDLGNNFFLEDAHLGQPRAQCVTALLQELNEHVRGSYVNDSIESVLAANPTFLDDFSLVVATQLPESSLRALAAACATRSLPLVVLRSYGLCGVVRLAACDHVVTEAHPDNVPSDLRVCSPFPELLAFASTRFGAMESLSAVERKHVPYVVLLLRALDAYKGTHGGALPSSYKEKQVVKAWLSATAEAWFGVGNAEDALNFEEAKAAVNTALAAPSLPANTRAVLAEAEARLGSAMSSEGSTSPIAPADATSNTHFWAMAAGLARYVASEGRGMLPLLGSLPDMTADTDSYVALSAVYRERALHEATVVHAHVQAVLASAGMAQDAVGLEQTRFFCKNAHGLQWIRYRSIEEELTPSTSMVPQLASLAGDGSTAPLFALHTVLRAADAFRGQYNRWPGTMDNDIEADVPLLKQFVGHILTELKAATGNAGLTVGDDLVYEICRYGAAEVHSVASVVGGVGAQEVIKLVTGQFVPLNNTFMYSGLNGTCATAEL